jgi:hypothetical protein
MATPKEGGNPYNIVPISLRRAPEQGRYHGVKTPEAMSQQRTDEALEAGRVAAKELLGDRWGATVFKGPFRVPRPTWPKNPGEQSGEQQPFQPNPAEQQAAERLGKPPPQETDNKLDSPVQEQGEPQAGVQEDAEELDFDIDFEVKPLPPATYVGPFGRRRPWRLNRNDPK